MLEGCKEFWTFSLYDVKDNVLLCAKLEERKVDMNLKRKINILIEKGPTKALSNNHLR